MKPLYVSVPADGPVAVRGTSVASADGGAIVVAVEGSARTDDATTGGSVADDSARIVLEAYRRHGPGFAGALRGRYAVAVADRTKGVVYAAGDRMGSTRVHYAATGRGSVVSTSLEEIRATPDVPTSIDRQAIYDYLYLHAIPAPRTFFSGVHTLRRAEAVALRGGSATVSRHWSPQWSSEAVDVDAAAEELRRRLRDAVARSVQAGAPKADCFLSGGLDSSSVAGTSAEIFDPREVGAYSIGFAEPAYDETEFARAAAERFGFRWHRHQLEPDEVLESLPSVDWRRSSSPSGTPPRLPCITVLASRRPGRDAPACGRRRGRDLRRQHPLREAAAVPAVLGGARFPALGSHRAAARRLRPALPSPRLKGLQLRSAGRVPLPDRLQSYNFVHRHRRRDDLHGRDTRAASDSRSPCELMRREYGRAGRPRTRWTACCSSTGSSRCTTTTSSRSTRCAVTRASRWRTRCSTTTRRVRCRLPADMKVRGNELRWFYRRAMRGFLPDVIIDKTKHGFGLPFGVWTRTHEGLSNLARDALHSLKMRRIVRPEFIDVRSTPPRRARGLLRRARLDPDGARVVVPGADAPRVALIPADPRQAGGLFIAGRAAARERHTSTSSALAHPAGQHQFGFGRVRPPGRSTSTGPASRPTTASSRRSTDRSGTNA